jgi:hypothetical protein
MIPGFVVPFYMLVHVATFAQFAVGTANERRLPLRSAA